ncbi:hypothetical protein OK016_06835 [Vibrio chagasii]|nr:hypothetical protein [Vibrio chagasii]
MDKVSVGATITYMCCESNLAEEGKTVLDNSAREPMKLLIRLISLTNWVLRFLARVQIRLLSRALSV